MTSFGLKVHLAMMDARDAWHALRPRLSELERDVVLSAGRARRGIQREIKALRRLRSDIAGTG